VPGKSLPDRCALLESYIHRLMMMNDNNENYSKMRNVSQVKRPENCMTDVGATD